MMDRVLTKRPSKAAGLRALAVGTAKEFWEDRVLGLAAEAAFWQLLSLPPLMLALLGSIGFFSGVVGGDDIIRIENSVLDAAGKLIAPSAVDSLVRPAVHDVLTTGRLDVVSIGFVISIWSGSTAMATFVNTITIAYDLRESRSAVRSRLLALKLYLGFVAAGIIILPALVLGPTVIVGLAPPEVHPQVATAVNIAYWPVVVLGCLGLLATLYRLSVPIRTKWVRAFPGAVMALVIWLLGSEGLRIYLSFVVHASSAYSSLSAPIAVLLFFWITALAVLIGAELNAEIDKLWPSRQTAEARDRGRIAQLAAGARRWVPTLRE